jgi:PAS domain S-box-containing protein
MDRFHSARRSLASGIWGSNRGYVVGLLTMLLLVVLRRYVLDSYFDAQMPLRLFILPVIAAAWSGGLAPGLSTTLLGSVAAPYFFGDPSTEAIDWQVTLNFLLVGLVVSGVTESLHVTRRRLEERQRQLEREMVERKKAEAAERMQRERLAQDIEQRALAESGLREREERIRMAVQSANIGTWDLNVLIGERKWSDRSKEMFGLAADEDASKLSFIELLHEDDRDRVSQARQQALDPQGDGRYEVEYRARWRDGTIRWIIAHGQVFFQGEGRDKHAVRFIGTVFDFSERKELEQALQDANRRKDEFLATLAHELRNPLSPISNALEIWPLVENDAHELEQLRGIMERQVRHIKRLIDDLMDVSRISRGRIELRKQRVDLGTVISEAIESVQPQIDASSHRLTVTLPAEPVFVDGDVARLTQVFGNILHNASKYSGRNGVIWVAADRHNGRVSVSIRDNGPGIPQHMLSQIFEMFRQVDQGLERSFGGLGIGLSLVKQLVELHGGTVEARSEGPGKGSEFIVTLPADPNGEQVRTARHSLHQLSNPPCHRILVVDDVQASATTLAMMLRGIRQDVAVANDGPAAIEEVLRFRPEIVFLDIAMPSMNGYEVARHLRAHEELQGLVLVALTGYGQEEDRRRAVEAGFDHHMVKPTNIEDLTSLLLTLP